MEIQFAGVFDNAAVGLVLTNVDGQIINVNRAFCELTGYRRTELIGRPHSDFAHPDFKSPPSDFRRLVAGEIDSYHREKLYVRKDGAPVWTTVSVSAQKDELGRRMYTINVIRDISDQKRAESALSESEARWRTLANTMPQLAWTADPDGTVDYYNGRLEQFVGFEFDQETGRWRWNAVVHPDDEELTERAWAEAVALGQEYVIEHRVRVKVNGDEGYRWFLSRAIPVRDSEDHVTKWYGTATDIHATKLAEEAMRESSDRFRAALKNPKFILAQVDREQRYLWIHNPHYDFDPSQVIGKRDDELDDSEGTRRLTVLKRQVIESGQGTRELISFQRSDGIRTYDINIEPLHDINGAVIGATSSAFDITDRIQAEEALLESERRYRGTFENAAVGVAHVSLDGNYLRVNQKLCDIFGYTEEELLTKTFKEITHPDDLEPDLEHIQRLLGGEGADYTFEKRYIRSDGTLVWVSLARSLVRKPDGSPDYFIAIVVDITLQKALEATLRHTNETLEQRVAERTTELETHAESLGLLAARLSQVEQRERRRLAELIHDDLQQLLVAARMQVNTARAVMGQEGAAGPHDLAVSLLDQAIEEARSLTTQLRPPALYESGLAASLGWLAGWMKQAYGFDVELKVDALAAGLPEQDAVMLFDSVREMLLNAVKYSGEHQASVSVSGEDDRQLVLSVSDGGKGFDMSVLDRPRTGSGGFGLFGIRERVVAMGGRFEVQSAPGQGATFKLFWPMTAPVDVESGGAEEPGREARLTQHPGSTAVPADQVSVLLVDDHALVRQSLADVLNRQPDMAVTAEASDGEQAIEAVEMYRPHVVVMDVNLPGLNGIQATRIIKEQHPGILVIVVSVHNDTATRRAMMDAGASAYLSKDGPVETLVETIRRQVQLAQSRRK